MASAARAYTLVWLLAALFMGTAAADHGGQDRCIQRDDKVSKAGASLCYDKCSDGGGLTNAESQICFVNCVLRWGCRCPGDPPSPTPGLPALLDGTVRVTVTRPSRIEEEEAEEVLVVEVTFEDDDPPFFSVHVNEPEEEERLLSSGWDSVGSKTKFTKEEKRNRKAVVRIPIGYNLKRMGADGDKTIVVSFRPLEVNWTKGHRLYISAVRIEYEPKNYN